MKTLDDFKDEGTILRDKGIETAIEHADEVEPSWSEQAMGMLLKYPNTIFTTEELRLWAYEQGFAKPPNERAWGGVVVRARNKGIIVWKGYERAKDPLVHKNTVSQWEKIHVECEL